MLIKIIWDREKNIRIFLKKTFKINFELVNFEINCKLLWEKNDLKKKIEFRHFEKKNTDCIQKFGNFNDLV